MGGWVDRGESRRFEWALCCEPWLGGWVGGWVGGWGTYQVVGGGVVQEGVQRREDEAAHPPIHPFACERVEEEVGGVEEALYP